MYRWADQCGKQLGLEILQNWHWSATEEEYVLKLATQWLQGAFCLVFPEAVRQPPHSTNGDVTGRCAFKFVFPP